MKEIFEDLVENRPDYSETISKDREIRDEYIHNLIKLLNMRSQLAGPDKRIVEYKNQIIPLKYQLQKTVQHIEVLEPGTSLCEAQISALNNQLLEAKEIEDNLKLVVSELDNQIFALNCQLDKCKGDNREILADITWMRNGIAYELLMKYHNGFVENAHP
jgi:chromosome segregation ATPase